MSAFIIKLALMGSGVDAVFRRIPVQMTEAHLQNFIFQDLKRHAILLSLGEGPSNINQDDADTYKVAFVYTDVDGDKAMIASDADLQELIQQFSKKGSVKVFATVEDKKDEKFPCDESAAESSTQTVHSAVADSITQMVHSLATAISSFSATQTARTSATALASGIPGGDNDVEVFPCPFCYPDGGRQREGKNGKVIVRKTYRGYVIYCNRYVDEIRCPYTIWLPRECQAVEIQNVMCPSCSTERCAVRKLRFVWKPGSVPAYFGRDCTICVLCDVNFRRELRITLPQPNQVQALPKHQRGDDGRDGGSSKRRCT